jgi:uncharacterized membrane protein
MPAALRSWLLALLTITYLVSAHIGISDASRAATVFATAALAALFALSISRPAPRAIAAAAGVAAVVAIARGVPPVPLLLPPVLIPAGIAWVFGRTLKNGRRALVERIARGFHAPAVPAPRILAYARRVTWAWTLLLSTVALVNLWLVVNLVPGGIADVLGVHTAWAVAPLVFVWFANTGTYLIIGAMFIVEFSIRLWRFPDYRFRNPVAFAREARTRLPKIVEALRDE